MTGWFFTRIALAALFGVVVGAAIAVRMERNGKERNGRRSRVYWAYSYAGCIPLFILAVWLLNWAFYGAEQAMDVLLALCFNTFLLLFVYYAILSLLMPWLRERISGWACVSLWLLPNVLYIIQIQRFAAGMPLFVIVTSGDWAFTLLSIWLAGCCLLLLYKIAEHLVFRRRILRGAVEAEPVAQALFIEELELAQFRGRRPLLLRSGAVATPLSIGMFRSTLRIVLPERAYSEDELRLVLRHEIVHICHDDASAKFSLVSVVAMCWFNPLVWLAMRRSAEDLELSCDEAVLFGAPKDERRRYADLLLSTAGDARGFTTCLSATGRSLRYRLKNVMQPPMKAGGALAIGLAVFFMLLCFGQVALAYGGGVGRDVIFNAHELSEYRLQDEPGADEEALIEYLASLELRELTGSYDFDTFNARHRGFRFEGPQGEVYVGLYDNAVEVLIYSEDRRLHTYYVPGGVDWELVTAAVGA